MPHTSGLVLGVSATGSSYCWRSRSAADWMGWSLPFCSSPSTVVICAPSACTASTVQDFTGSPSSSTVQAPQCVVSQPMCVPVRRRFSRSRWTRRSRDSTWTAWATPFTVTWMSCRAMSPTSCPLEGLLEGARGEHPPHLALVFDRAAPVGGGRRRLRRAARRLGDRGVVRSASFEVLLRGGGARGDRAGVGQREADPCEGAASVQRHLRGGRGGRVVSDLALQFQIRAARPVRRDRDADLRQDLVARE